MAIVLGARSLSRLQGVHPDLVRVIKRAAVISDMDFTVLEGLRTPERQQELMKKGATKTLNSRHLTGHAVDIAPMIGGTVRWDWPLYYKLAEIVKVAAEEEKVPVTWGGDWRTFKDGPHWELPWKQYPKGK
jgi:peptidoglycan L-alanyl-D-glutamate endopeptidase CwlK